MLYEFAELKRNKNDVPPVDVKSQQTR